MFQQNTKQRDMSGRARTCEGWIGSHPTQIFLGFFTSPFLSPNIISHLFLLTENLKLATQKVTMTAIVTVTQQKRQWEQEKTYSRQQWHWKKQSQQIDRGKKGHTNPSSGSDKSSHATSNSDSNKNSHTNTNSDNNKNSHTSTKREKYSQCFDFYLHHQWLLLLKAFVSWWQRNQRSRSKTRTAVRRTVAELLTMIRFQVFESSAILSDTAEHPAPSKAIIVGSLLIISKRAREAWSILH